MIKKKQLSEAFTLIELLVVITIIGILAGIALPVFSQVQEKAQQTKSLAGAKQVGLALKLYAGDNDGNFPLTVGNPGAAVDANSVATYSNQAFASLFPTYCSAEKLFYTPKSKWCNTTAPDEVYGTQVDCLKAGENEYAYIKNLNDTSNAALPLVFDAPITGGTTYTTDRTVAGGVWGGKKAIIIHVDDSGEVANCDTLSTTSGAVQRTPSAGGAKINIFSTTDTNWLSSTNTILYPIAPTAQ